MAPAKTAPGIAVPAIQPQPFFAEDSGEVEELTLSDLLTIRGSLAPGEVGLCLSRGWDFLADCGALRGQVLLHTAWTSSTSVGYVNNLV